MLDISLVKVILAIIAVLIAITFIQPATYTAPFVADLKGTYSLTLTYSLAHLLTHLLTYSLTHSYLLTHSLTHALTYIGIYYNYELDTTGGTSYAYTTNSISEYLTAYDCAYFAYVDAIAYPGVTTDTSQLNLNKLSTFPAGNNEFQVVKNDIVGIEKKRVSDRLILYESSGNNVKILVVLDIRQDNKEVEALSLTRTHSLTYLLTYSLTHSLTHLLTHLPTHLLTYSPTYSLTHSYSLYFLFFPSMHCTRYIRQCFL